MEKWSNTHVCLFYYTNTASPDWRRSLSARLALNIIRKDWLEYRKPIALLTGGMFIPLMVANRSSDFSKGMLAGVLISASYSFAYSCFISERQRGTLQLLLSLPLESFELVLAKYASLYSMALVTANVPAIFLGDLR